MIKPARAGILYLVATPIGNRQDLSFRALDILKKVDVILAEDTRHTLPLLAFYAIESPLMSFHLHNEESRTADVIQRLLAGQSCALVSDAGTPLISDPGYPLVKSARAHGVQVVPIPGACALIAALSASGLPCEPFTFLGFLPTKSSARLAFLKNYEMMSHTFICYESSHRILESILDIGVCFGENSEIVLAKELTKSFETFVSGNSQKIHAWLLEDPLRQKGEFVIMVAPRSIEKETKTLDVVLGLLMEELPLKQAVSLASKIIGVGKNEVYERALEKKQQEN